MKHTQLSNEDITAFSDEIRSFLTGVKLSSQNKHWLELTLEELLLKYRDVLSEKAAFAYQYKKRFGSVLIELFVSGEKHDMLHPEGKDEETEDFSIFDHLFNTGVGQVLYRYRDGYNVISISMPLQGEAKKFFENKMLWAILLAVGAGLLMRLLPASTRDVINTGYVSPIYSTLMAVLKGVTEPVIFISLVVGICALDDIESMNTHGKKILLAFLKITTVMFLLALAVCLPIFGGRSSGSVSFRFSELLPLLLQSLPGSFFAPFTEGNMIQIVVIGFVTGITLLTLGEKAGTIKRLIRELKFFFFSVLEVFVKCLPVVVFLSVIKVLLSVDVSESALIWKIMAADILLDIIFALGFTLFTAIKCKLRISVLLKKMLPMMSLSFTTGSSTAVIPLFYEHLPKDFGIDEKFANYWIPLSNAFFSPSTIFALIVYAFFASQMQGTGTSLSWIIVLYIMIIQIGMATPRIPGGIIASVTILFSQLGLSTDQLGVIMSANVLILYLDTAVAAMTRCLGAILVARKEDSLDIEKLRT